MKYTEKFRLRKPDNEDFYDVSDSNYNADIVDAALRDLKTASERHSDELSDSHIGWDGTEYPSVGDALREQTRQTVSYNHGLRSNKLTDPTDYNALVTPGLYYVVSSATAKTMTNCPTSYGHRLDVYSVYSSQTIVQRVTVGSQGNPAIYYRTGTQGAWSEWWKVASAEDVQSALNISGGIVTQLYKYDTTSSPSGVTVTLGSNGSITLNGAPSGEGDFTFSLATSSKMQPLKSGHVYLLRGWPKNDAIRSHLRVTVYGSIDSVRLHLEDYGDGCIRPSLRTLPDDENNTVCCAIRFAIGDVFENFTFTPQLVDLTDTYGRGYEPTSAADFERDFGEDPYPFWDKPTFMQNPNRHSNPLTLNDVMNDGNVLELTPDFKHWDYGFLYTESGYSRSPGEMRISSPNRRTYDHYLFTEYMHPKDDMYIICNDQTTPINVEFYRKVGDEYRITFEPLGIHETEWPYAANVATFSNLENRRIRLDDDIWVRFGLKATYLGSEVTLPKIVFTSSSPFGPIICGTEYQPIPTTSGVPGVHESNSSLVYTGATIPGDAKYVFLEDAVCVSAYGVKDGVKIDIFDRGASTYQLNKCFQSFEFPDGFDYFRLCLRVGSTFSPDSTGVTNGNGGKYSIDLKDYIRVASKCTVTLPFGNGKVAYDRAKRITNMEWYAKNRVSIRNHEVSHPDFVPSDRPYYGVPYSSYWSAPKCPGWHLSWHTFKNAINDPNSIFYKSEHVGSDGNWGGAGYGLVCTSFALLAAGWPYPMTNECMPNHPYVQKIMVNDVPLGVPLNDQTDHCVFSMAKVQGEGYQEIVLAQGTEPTSRETAHYTFMPGSEAVGYTSDTHVFAERFRNAIMYAEDPTMRKLYDIPYDIDDGIIVNGGARPYKGDRSVYTSEENITVNVIDDNGLPAKVFCQKCDLNATTGELTLNPESDRISIPRSSFVETVDCLIPKEYPSSNSVFTEYKLVPTKTYLVSAKPLITVREDPDDPDIYHVSRCESSYTQDVTYIQSHCLRFEFPKDLLDNAEYGKLYYVAKDEYRQLPESGETTVKKADLHFGTESTETYTTVVTRCNIDKERLDDGGFYAIWTDRDDTKEYFEYHAVTEQTLKLVDGNYVFGTNDWWYAHIGGRKFVGNRPNGDYQKYVEAFDYTPDGSRWQLFVKGFFGAYVVPVKLN